MLSVLGVIPARLASTRLPRKVLRPLAGRPLVAWVYEAARKAPDLGDVVVATDSDEVMQACRALAIPAVLTSPEHPSGTDRVWEVAQSRPADVYVNIQGDEPFVTAGHVARLVEPFRRDAGTQVSTLCIRATPAEIDARQVNKVVFGAGGRALYFSKYGIPFDRDNRGASGDCRRRFSRLPPPQNSSARYGWPSRSPTSKTCTTLGCWRRATASASARKRARSCSAASSPARIILSATTRLSLVCLAL